MEASSPEDLHDELARLEAEEKQLSAQRRFLHQQIDFGYASDQTRAREREVSDERRRLHQQIDALRAILGPQGVSP
jgi:predicted  nucleic acid-binding Zn-ribbon protein